MTTTLSPDLSPNAPPLVARARARRRIGTLLLAGLLSGCTATPAGESDSEGDSDSDSDSDGDPIEGLVPEHFLEGALSGPITEVECTLTNGETTTCYSIPIVGAPADHEVGPFCPRTIDDGPESVGLWIDDGQVFDADGAFVVGLADYYNGSRR